jgi:GH15 family glucan-1,4-alpha-glucosidase
MALRIEDYALIGDCKTAALVGCDGSIDWLCWPRFDSPACFAALLGGAENGRWLIAPKEPPLAVSRRYRPGTLILETKFETESGSAAVVDFMVLGDGAHLLRIVMGQAGRVDFRTEFVARFNYGSTVPWVNRLDDGAINAIAGPERVVLRTPIALYGEDLRTRGEFGVEAGESIPFVLSHGLSFATLPPRLTHSRRCGRWRGSGDAGAIDVPMSAHGRPRSNDRSLR